MTTIDQPELVFPSAPIEGETKATVDLVANDWLADREWEQFKDVCQKVAWDDMPLWRVDPNLVRPYFQDVNGDMDPIISPRRYSAFWSRAAGKNGFLVADGWTINDDAKGHNKGKPQRMYRLRTAS